METLIISQFEDGSVYIGIPAYHNQMQYEAHINYIQTYRICVIRVHDAGRIIDAVISGEITEEDLIEILDTSPLTIYMS